MSNADLDILVQMLPPPTRNEKTSKSWSTVEDELQLILPNDYKLLVETYGSGRIDEWLSWFDPCGETRFAEYARRLIGNFLSIKEPDEYAVDFYPTAGGLLPFGVNDNLYTLCWKTDGVPDDWQIFWWDADYSTIHETEHRSAIAALIEILSGHSELAKMMLPAARPGVPHRFITY